MYAKSKTMQLLAALFPLAILLSPILALPSPMTPSEAAIQQIQQAQAASPDTTGATQASLQAQINALAAMPNAFTGSPYWGASYHPYMGTSYNGYPMGTSYTGWTPAQNALTAQIQAIQQQMVGMTDPAAVAALQNQIMALQTQIGASGTAPGMMPVGTMPGGMVAYNGWTPTQNALTSQMQALQQQMVGMTDPAQIAAMQNQIMALQTQIGMSGMAPGMMMPAGVMPGGMAMPVAQQQNAALMAQIQAMQQQMAMMGSNPAAQQAMMEQIAAVQHQMV
ncbi:hypothetical protein HDU98_003739 [Podochytrium sp. JEL0797]|nr:hypothetical protein HDU98_003739 [Podochytrium sp. JEL0797]